MEQNSPNAHTLSNPKKPPASQLMVVKRQNKKKQFRGHWPKTVGHPPMPSYCRAQRYRAHIARHSTPSLESCPLNRTWELSHTTLIVSDKIQNRQCKAPLKLGFLCLHHESEDRTKGWSVWPLQHSSGTVCAIQAQPEWQISMYHLDACSCICFMQNKSPWKWVCYKKKKKDKL